MTLIQILSTDTVCNANIGFPWGFGEFGRKAIYFQGAMEHW